jgi:predicted peptidase
VLWFEPDAETLSQRPWPAILFLHGVGERGSGGKELARVAKWGLPKFRQQKQSPLAEPFPFLVAAPQCPEDRTWGHGEVLAALDLLAEVMIEAGADPARLYLSGFSMGGIGCFHLALRQPHRFAAVAPVCGMCETPDALARLAHLPLWIAYGEDDEIEYLTEGSREAVRRLAPFGRVTERPYRLGPADGLSAHVRTGDAAYSEPELYQWMLAQRKAEVP